MTKNNTVDESGMSVVRLEMTVFHGPNTVTHGWQPWEEVDEVKYAEIEEYIKQGYNYRLRKLYAVVEPMADDRPPCPVCNCRYLELHHASCDIQKRGSRHVYTMNSREYNDLPEHNQ